jgi:hypothetical protein
MVMADHHLVLQGGVALARLLAGAAEGHALVEHHPVADLGRLADHHAHAVIDEEAPADRGAGVDLDACEEARELGDQAGEEGHAPPVDGVGETMEQQRVQAGVEQHLGQGVGRGVVAKDCPHVVAEHAQSVRERHREPPAGSVPVVAAKRAKGRRHMRRP